VVNDPVNWIDPDGLTLQGATYGAALFGGTAAVLSVVADVGSFGVNIPASPSEIALATVTGAVVGDVVSDFANNVSKALDNIYEMSKGGKQNVGDTGFIGVSDEEVKDKARDKSLPADVRRKYQTEEKHRKMRNIKKRCQ
jgi:hypothetical protein